MTLYEKSSSNFSDEGSQMLSTEEIEMMDVHDYANPQELKKSLEKVDGVKKKNLVYEPLPPRNKTNGFAKTACSPSSYEEKLLLQNKKSFMKERLQRFLIVVIILMSLGSFTLSVLTTFGVTQASCNKCVKEVFIPVSSGASLKGGHAMDVEKFTELENNITYLKKMLASLQNHVKFLESNYSVFKTFQQGPPGPPGPPGDYYIKKCEFRTKIVSSPYKNDVSLSMVEVEAESKEDLIIGVTCMGGEENGLIYENVGNKPVFKCRCAGAPKTKAFYTDELKCRAQYWVCPI
ncbi:uncharacterized protein LOC100197871 [Hydra vulgaris]|uniref:uncharacterized protein LOC100197871 n=1 Tax=Hydra vulgaris TaxID=6087 RepID=UPI001F5FCF8A|nr:uncharacterized protein LOC100197871 [Hydra vulgaris]